MTDLTADPAKVGAGMLAGTPVESVAQVGGGRNSRVYRIVAGGVPYALKQYPSRADDPRDRQGTEAAALRWMADHSFTMVPRLIALDEQTNHSLLSWVEGALVRDVLAADVDQAVNFLRRLHALRSTPAVSPERLATEACLSGAEIERQIRTRVASLGALPDQEALGPFMANEFNPALEELLAIARQRMRAAGQIFDVPLPIEKRSLVPSDFGYHNALRNNAGQLTFIDFEYFGWDDPVKLTADILLHPGTWVSEELHFRFRRAAEQLYGDDSGFADRLGAYYPLFGLRWVLILLNEFHPDRWRRRVLAGAVEDWESAKARQLKAAVRLLQSLSS